MLKVDVKGFVFNSECGRTTTQCECHLEMHTATPLRMPANGLKPRGRMQP